MHNFIHFIPHFSWEFTGTLADPNHKQRAELSMQNYTPTVALVYSSGQGSSAHALASFGAGQAYLKCWKVTAERPPPVFWRDTGPRQAPRSQQWYDGYTVTGNAIILLLRLISSGRSGSLPSHIISPIHLPPKMYCDMDLLHCQKQCVWGCIYVSAFHCGISEFINTLMWLVSPKILNTGLDYCLKTNAMSARLANQRLFVFMLLFFSPFLFFFSVVGETERNNNHWVFFLLFLVVLSLCLVTYSL